MAGRAVSATLRATQNKIASLASSGPERVAIDILADARCLARRHQRDAWDFAVELAVLLAAGVTVNDLRSLICQGAIAHAVEQPAATSRRRRFRPWKSLGFPPGTCFVLAEHVAVGRRRGASRNHSPERAGACELAGHPVAAPAALKPSWDRAARTLLLGRRVIKQLRVPAKCQETVLGVFEESGWPRCIDDPLPPNNGEDTRYRLHNTIKSLNGHHLARRIHFISNGDGTGVCWELIGR
jgi:hypothetical protein